MDMLSTLSGLGFHDQVSRFAALMGSAGLAGLDYLLGTDILAV